MPLLSNLSEIRQELRSRLDEAVIGQFDDVDLDFWIRHGADRVAKETKARRMTPLWLEAGKRINLPLLRFVEVWDQLFVYDQASYERITVIAAGQNNPRPLRVVHDLLTNRVFHTAYATAPDVNADIVNIITGNSSLWYNSLQLQDTSPLDEIFALAHSHFHPTMLASKLGADTVWQFDKATLVEGGQFTIPGAVLTEGVIHSSSYGSPLTTSGYAYFGDGAAGGIWQLNLTDGTSAFTAVTPAIYSLSIDEDGAYLVALGMNAFGFDGIAKVTLGSSPGVSAVLNGYDGPLGIHALDTYADQLYTINTLGGVVKVNQIDVSGTDPVFVSQTDLTGLAPPATFGRGVFSHATGEAVFTIDRMLLFYSPSSGEWRTMDMPSEVWGLDYDNFTGALWVASPSAPYIYRVDLVGQGEPAMIPFIPRGERWDHYGPYATIEETPTGQTTLELIPPLPNDAMLELRYVSLPHEMVADPAPCDIAQEMREAIVAEAEILAYERVNRDASWLQSKLKMDYQKFSSYEFQRSMSEYASVSSYD
jgi:hypothetical protein